MSKVTPIDIKSNHSIRIVQIKSDQPIQFDIEIDGIPYLWSGSRIQFPEPGVYINEFIVVTKRREK